LPAWILAFGCAKARLQDLQVPESIPSGGCLAVGFLGGHDARDDAGKGVRRLALRLRDPARHLYTETFSNHSRKLAEEFLLATLDRNGDGIIDALESRRLVIYGQSFGGAATVKFAWRLANLRVPVHLTVQIDSVGTDDDRIPPNVAHAANLYQKNGWIIRGENPIRAIDPSHTRILGNWRFDYRSPPGAEISIDDLSWWKKFMRIAHAKMDRDPRVWELVERLVRAACDDEDLVNAAPAGAQSSRLGTLVQRLVK
jgi:pimeloyl-ACP methyl ester carboxylesterase